MVDRFLAWEQVFHNMGRFKTTLTGVTIGMALSLPLVVGLSEGWFVLPFLKYFPIHAWLTISIFLVLFSSLERERILSTARLGFFGAFFHRIFSPFGLFCMGWFYAFVTIGWLAGAVE